MLSLKETLAKEHDTGPAMISFDAKCSLVLGLCAECGFYNRRPFKSKSQMNDVELVLLDMYESINGNKQPEKRAIVPMKRNGHWKSFCLPCAKKIKSGLKLISGSMKGLEE